MSKSSGAAKLSSQPHTTNNTNNMAKNKRPKKNKKQKWQQQLYCAPTRFVRVLKRDHCVCSCQPPSPSTLHSPPNPQPLHPLRLLTAPPHYPPPTACCVFFIVFYLPASNIFMRLQRTLCQAHRGYKKITKKRKYKIKGASRGRGWVRGLGCGPRSSAGAATIDISDQNIKQSCIN